MIFTTNDPTQGGWTKMKDHHHHSLYSCYYFVPIIITIVSVTAHIEQAQKLVQVDALDLSL